MADPANTTTQQPLPLPADAPPSAKPQAAESPPKKDDPARDYDGEIAKLQRALAKAEKAAKDAEAKASDPAALKGALLKMLNMSDDKDPAAEIKSREDKLANREKVARKALIQSHATAALHSADVTRIDKALRLLDLDDIDVDLDAGSVSSDVIKERVEKLKVDVPEFFKQAPPPATTPSPAPIAGKVAPPVPSIPPTSPQPVKLSTADLWKAPLSTVRDVVGLNRRLGA